MNAKDYFDNEIREGDIIAYPGRGGSSLWMNHGRVIEIIHKKRWECGSDKMVTKLRVEKLGMKTSRVSTIECFYRIINLSRVAEFGVL